MDGWMLLKHILAVQPFTIRALPPTLCKGKVNASAGGEEGGLANYAWMLSDS